MKRGEWRREVWRMGMMMAALLMLAGCERSNPSAKAPPALPSGQEFAVHGTIKKIQPAAGRAVIAHQEIPGYMSAMTMEFEAATPSELAGLEPGDVVDFRLTVSDSRSSIDHLRKTGHTAIPADEVPGVPAPGTAVPDVQLTDDRGRAVRLSDFRGRVVACTFIFTRCPLPDFCPRMNQHFAAAARELAGEAGEGWQLLSITIDPEHDTPAILAEYARAFRLAEAEGRWSFVTGPRAEIEKLGKFCGLATKGEGAALEHNLRTVVVDREGKVAQIFAGNDWQPGELVEAMRRAGK